MVPGIEINMSDIVVYYTYRDGLDIKISASVYSKGIRWDYFEHMQFYEGDSDSALQTFAEYRAEGPPAFARNFPRDKIDEIEKLIKNQCDGI
jgi:hypothetical protein